MVKTKDSGSHRKIKTKKATTILQSDEPGDSAWLIIDKIIYRMVCAAIN
jgi:hypothetical protein